MRRAVAACTALVALLVSVVASACPVCGVGTNEANRQAFIGSTIFLSLLPLAMMGGLIGWGIWHVRRRERERETAFTSADPLVLQGLDTPAE